MGKSTIKNLLVYTMVLNDNSMSILDLLLMLKMSTNLMFFPNHSFDTSPVHVHHFLLLNNDYLPAMLVVSHLPRGDLVVDASSASDKRVDV